MIEYNWLEVNWFADFMARNDLFRNTERYCTLHLTPNQNHKYPNQMPQIPFYPETHLVLNASVAFETDNSRKK